MSQNETSIEQRSAAPWPQKSLRTTGTSSTPFGSSFSPFSILASNSHPESTQTCRRIGPGRQLRYRRAFFSGNFCRRRLRDSNARVPIQMVLAASRAVTSAGVFIAQAREFIAIADTFAIPSLRSRLDGNECHGFSLVEHNMGARSKKGKPSSTPRCLNLCSYSIIALADSSNVPVGKASRGFRAIPSNAVPGWS